MVRCRMIHCRSLEMENIICTIGNIQHAHGLALANLSNRKLSSSDRHKTRASSQLHTLIGRMNHVRSDVP